MTPKAGPECLLVQDLFLGKDAVDGLAGHLGDAARMLKPVLADTAGLLQQTVHAGDAAVHAAAGEDDRSILEKDLRLAFLAVDDQSAALALESQHLHEFDNAEGREVTVNGDVAAARPFAQLLADDVRKRVPHEFIEDALHDQR